MLDDGIQDIFCYHKASMETAAMLHGRRRTNSSNKTLFQCLYIRSKTTIPHPNTLKTKLGTFLLVASIAKSLSEPGGSRNLNNGELSLISLSETLVLQILRRSSLDVSKKIDFFKWCSLRHNYILQLLDSVTDENKSFVDVAACNEQLVALRNAGMQAEFRNVFDKLREEINDFPVDVWGYNVCIHGFGNWGELETSLNLFKEMKEKSVTLCNLFAPDLCTYNSLIQALCFNGKVKDALIVWEEVKSSGHEPDAFTYRITYRAAVHVTR